MTINSTPTNDTQSIVKTCVESEYSTELTTGNVWCVMLLFISKVFKFLLSEKVVCLSSITGLNIQIYLDENMSETWFVDMKLRNLHYSTNCSFSNFVHKCGVILLFFLLFFLSVYLQIQIVTRNATYMSISLSTFLRYLSRLLSLSSISSVPHRTAKETIQEHISICTETLLQYIQRICKCYDKRFK